MIRLDGEGHVDVFILSNVVGHPGAVGLWYLDGGHGSSFDDEIVDREFGRGHFVQFGSELHEVVDLHGVGNVVVWDVLLGVSEPVGDDLPDVRVLKVNVTALDCVENWGRYGAAHHRWSLCTSRSDSSLNVSLDDSSLWSSTFNAIEANVVRLGERLGHWASEESIASWLGGSW